MDGTAVNISKRICDGSRIDITLKVTKSENECRASIEEIEKDVQDVLSNLLIAFCAEVCGNNLSE